MFFGHLMDAMVLGDNEIMRVSGGGGGEGF